MNCPECGALNPEDAAFCSLCLTPLVTEPAPADPAPAEAATEQPAHPDGSQAAPVASAADGSPSAGEAADAGGGAATATHGRFRQTDEGMEWSCDVCETWNPLEVLSCTVCGRSFREQLTGSSADPHPRADGDRIRNLSLLLPGLGHFILGDAVMGLARMIVAVLWVGGGLLLVIEASSAGQSPMPALPLLMGAVVLWAVTYLDAQALAAGQRRQLLDARRFLWLFIGVMVASVVMFFPGFLSARG